MIVLPGKRIRARPLIPGGRQAPHVVAVLRTVAVPEIVIGLEFPNPRNDVVDFHNLHVHDPLSPGIPYSAVS